jgi:hypothetical protein
MVHAALRDAGVQGTDDDQGEHNTEPWCEQITRITPQLGLTAIQAAPVRPRRIDGKVTRRALDGHLSREDIAHWPHSLRPAGLSQARRIVTVHPDPPIAGLAPPRADLGVASPPGRRVAPA